jgi:thioredoxin 1
MSQAKNVTTDSFQTEVLQATRPVLVDFYADWCGPCRQLGPTLDRLATEFAGRVDVVKVNIDQEPGLADQFNVASIPTLIAFQAGQVVGQAAGFVAEQPLRDAMNKLAEQAA